MWGTTASPRGSPGNALWSTPTTAMHASARRVGGRASAQIRLSEPVWALCGLDGSRERLDHLLPVPLQLQRAYARDLGELVQRLRPRANDRVERTVAEDVERRNAVAIGPSAPPRRELPIERVVRLDEPLERRRRRAGRLFGRR